MHDIRIAMNQCPIDLGKQVTVYNRRREGMKYIKVLACGAGVLGAFVICGVFVYTNIDDKWYRRVNCPPRAGR